MMYSYDTMDTNYDARTPSTKRIIKNSSFRSNSPKKLRHSQPAPLQSYVRDYHTPIRTVKRSPNVPTPAQKASTKPITVERFYD